VTLCALVSLCENKKSLLFDPKFWTNPRENPKFWIFYGVFPAEKKPQSKIAIGL
jgi:hypothetical protein